MNKSRSSQLFSVMKALSGNSRWREVFGLLFLAAGYWLTVWSGLLLLVQPEKIASIWPASGVALAALLINPKRLWLKILLILFAINMTSNWIGGNLWWASMGFALVNTLEALLCAWTLQYVFKSAITFERSAEVIALLCVAIFANGLTALLGAAIPALEFGSPFASTWLTWWIADGLGIILITPIVVAWNSNLNTDSLLYKRHSAETVLFMLTLLAFAALLFGPFTSAEKPLLRNYMLFPLLIWLAFRFSMRDVANALFMFSTIAIWNTLQGRGIFGFADQTQVENLIALQIYLSVAAFSGLLLSSMVTERKQAEEALRESEGKYTRLFDNTNLGIFQSTPDGKAILVNFAFARMFGYDSPADALQSIKDVGVDIFMDPNRRAEILRLMTENPVLRVFENLYRRKDGSSFTGRLNTIPIRDSEGRLIRIEGIIEDITERKRAEEALRVSEEKYRMVANFTYDWEAWHAPYGVYLYVSPSCERITGYTAEEFLADANLIVQITHPEDRANIVEHFQATVNHSKGKDNDFDFRIITKSGEMRWINHTCTAVYSEDGKWLGRRESNRDITARKQSEAVLRSRLQLAQFADDHSADDVMQYVLNEAEALTESVIAFFHTLEPDQKTITLQMWSANTLQNMCSAEGLSHQYDLSEAGVWVDCVRKREPVIYNDYPSLPDAHRKGLPKGHAPMQRILTVPIFHNDMIVAIVGVGNKPKDYVYQDVKTVQQIAELAWDVIRRKHSEKEVRQAKDALEIALEREKKLSHSDPLLGIHNRRYLFELAEREFDIATRHQLPLSIIMFDIDFFKKVNDTYGHDIGDQVLQRVVEAATAELRSSDVIGRYGGEEFVVILPLTTAQQAHPVAERIRAGVEALRVPTHKGDATATLSIGIVELLTGLQIISVDDLIRRADEAMYAAKQAGRNRISIYEWEQN